MKTARTISAATLAIFGLILAGSDAGDFGLQVIASTFGVCLMIIGGLWIIDIEIERFLDDLDKLVTKLKA